MDAPVHIAILLRESCRNPQGRARAEAALSQLGVRVTHSGPVSISGKVSKEDCRRLFGTMPTEVPPQPPGELDFGAPGGYECQEELKVPQELAEFAESVSVVPPARRLWSD